MNILFKGKTISTKEWVESDSILQGKKTDGIRIFLKHKDTFPKWVECDVKTVTQIK
tara:strand:+ start:5161 stop:5328 length:168 start_codon:yes stop_codon:yes gene_type:complete